MNIKQVSEFNCKLQNSNDDLPKEPPPEIEPIEPAEPLSPISPQA